MIRPLTHQDVVTLERGLYERLSAPPTKESQTDLLDYATRAIRALIASHKKLQTTNLHAQS